VGYFLLKGGIQMAEQLKRRASKEWVEYVLERFNDHDFSENEGEKFWREAGGTSGQFSGGGAVKVKDLRRMLGHKKSCRVKSKRHFF